MFLKLVHDIEGKELNCHDPCLSQARCQVLGYRRQNAPLSLRSSQPRWEMQFHISCHSLSCGLGAQVFRFSRILRKNQKSRFYMFPDKTILPIFKCWQLIQIYINYCVGQTKHAWRLNLAHRPPVFNLCSRRTEFQWGWNKFTLWNRATGVLSSPPPPLLGSWKPRRWDWSLGLGKRGHGRRSFLGGQWGSLQPSCRLGKDRPEWKQRLL